MTLKDPQDLYLINKHFMNELALSKIVQCLDFSLPSFARNRKPKLPNNKENNSYNKILSKSDKVPSQLVKFIYI